MAFEPTGTVRYPREGFSRTLDLKRAILHVIELRSDIVRWSLAHLGGSRFVGSQVYAVKEQAASGN